MARLAVAAQAWLPTDVPSTRRHILDLLVQATATGANPIDELRQSMSRWFGADAVVMLPPVSPGAERPAAPDGIALEPLAVLRRPTLWPQRPKRLPDELFSSWLWRVSVAAAALPADFARDVVGAAYNDIDLAIAPESVRRLARLSGQSAGHLAAGTLPVQPWANSGHDRRHGRGYDVAP